jgi:hypothetical protein
MLFPDENTGKGAFCLVDFQLVRIGVAATDLM